MVWSDFQIPEYVVVANSKIRIDFNTGCVLNATLEVGSNCGIFKQTSENNPDEFHSARRSKDVLKGQGCGNEIFENSIMSL